MMLRTFLAAALILGLAGVLAACGDDPIDKPTPVNDEGGTDGTDGADVTSPTDEGANGDQGTTTPDEGKVPPDEGKEPDPECVTAKHCTDKVTLGPCEVATCTDGKCGKRPATDGAVCEVAGSDKCVAGGACEDGDCVAVTKTCDDGNACTEDSCEPSTGECKWKPIDGCDAECTSVADCLVPGDLPVCETVFCEESKCVTGKAPDGADCLLEEWGGDKCVVGGGCVAGACEKELKNCDDGLECTTDTCDPATGQCKNVDEGGTCTPDQCEGDADCQAVLGPLVCKLAKCVDGQCKATGAPDGAGCLLGVWEDNPCITGGACKEGSCIKQEKVCDDGLECTTDVCDPTTGKCVFKSEGDCGQECSDAAPCPAGWWCDKSLFGKDLCKQVKANGSDCGGNEECESGMCGGCLLNKWCFVQKSKGVGDSCFVDEECGSGDCTSACNTLFPKAGQCVCQDDEDCGAGAYCSSGSVCLGKKTECLSCSNNFECLSDFCDESWLGTGGKCVTQESLDLGKGCCKDKQCKSGICKESYCVSCADDDDCAEGQQCTNNQCSGKKPLGEPCSSNSQCVTGSCKGSLCVCTKDEDCGDDGSYCDMTFLGNSMCTAKKADCKECGAHEQCISGFCDGLWWPGADLCVTQESLELGDECCKGAQCKSGSCGDNGDGLDVCECDDDGDCPAGKKCDKPWFGPNTCK